MSCETEASLIICADDPRKIYESISNLKSISNYQLQDNGNQEIKEFYFDLAKNTLQENRVALRIRFINKVPFISLKGPVTEINDDYVNRMEFEKQLSQSSLQDVLHELKIRRIMMPDIDQGYSKNNDPIDFLKSKGLEQIQTHCTYRKRKNIISNKQSDEVVAEMDIDRVTFEFKNKHMKHYNIEIEKKSKGTPMDITRIASYLSSQYNSNSEELTLRKWSYGKFATGKCIKKLVESDNQNEIFSGDHLTRSAYDKIEKLIKSRYI